MRIHRLLSAVITVGLVTTAGSIAAKADVAPPSASSPPLSPLTTGETDAGGLPAWGTERVPQVGSGRSQLNSVSLVSATDGWAVGNSGFDLGEDAAPLVERWDGSQWSVVAVPDLTSAELRGVVAIESDDVWMVGAFNTTRESLILHWDGTAIERVPNPNPGSNRNDLYSVAASGPDDVWAVGSKTTGVSDPLTLHWDGATWSEVAVPKTGNYDQLNGVTAVGPDDAWAVGEFAYEAAAVHWDGDAWTRVEVPAGSSSMLDAVSAATSSDVWAVGQDDSGTLAARWNGTRWQVVDTPDSGGFLRDELLGVAAIASDEAWAVGTTGYGVSIALRWDGREWDRFPVPGDQDAYAALRSVVSSPDGLLMMAGSRERRANALELKHDSLRKVPVEQVGTDSNQLLGISAAAPADIWAVGGVGESFDSRPLTLHYDGDRWQRVRAPAPPEGTLLQDVVTIGPDEAWAVGATNPGDLGKAVALHWDGDHWQRVRVPQPGDAYGSPRLLAVDATAPDDVWAVGAYDLDGDEQPLILHWNGTKWRESTSCATYGGLAGVSFLNPDDGWVVSHASSCHWDGKRWSFVATPTPRGGSYEIDYRLEGVSAVTADDAWTVGTVVFDFGEYVSFGSLAFHWDGSQWQRVQNPGGVSLNDVEAVATDDVWAVGSDSYGPLIVRWDGRQWTDIPTPDRENGLDLEGLTRDGVDLWDAGRALGSDGLRSLVQRAPSPTEGAVLGSSNVGGATVSWTGPETGAIETEPTGDFQLGGLRAGHYRFTLAYQGCAPAIEKHDVVAGKTGSLDLQADCG